MQIQLRKWEIGLSGLGLLAGYWIYNVEVSVSFQLRGTQWLWPRYETW